MTLFLGNSALLHGRNDFVIRSHNPIMLADLTRNYEIFFETSKEHK